MRRSDYTFTPLSWEQYDAIIRSGTMPGYTSPMRNREDYDSLIAVMQAADIDPRLPLAFTFCEGHHGSDPGLVAAGVHNLGGVKFVRQAGATDSGIEADTGGTYAAFSDLTVYWREWVRIMGNSIIGPDFRAGNLIGAVEHYTNGIGTGHNKVDKWQQYVRDYPPTGGATVPTANAVYGDDLIAYLRTLIGQTHSTAETDPRNGVHPWAYWCESLAERVPERFGLSVTPRPSATAKGRAYEAQGLLRTTDTPGHGDHVIFDGRFYATDHDGDGEGDGHIGFWDADRGQLLGTVTDGTGIGYRDWGPQTHGYMGHARIPGVVAAHRPTDAGAVGAVGTPSGGNLVWPGNPHNAGRDAKNLLGVGGGIGDFVMAIPDSIRLRLAGYPLTNEYDATLTTPEGAKKPVTAQDFERLRLVFDGAEPHTEWRVRAPLTGEKVEKR